MSGYLQTGLGIAVSIILFLIGYRQTIGARKERAKAANSALRRALLRRVVLEAYQPRATDLERLLKGYALQHAVRIRDLFSVEQLLNLIYVDAFDNDLVGADKRGEVEARIAAAYADLSRADQRAEEVGTYLEAPDVTSRSIAALVAAATLAGTLVTLFTEFARGEIASATTIAFVVAGSVSVILAILLFRRTRERTEEPPQERISSPRHARYEREVLRAIRKSGVPFRAGVALRDGLYADFVLEPAGRRIVVTVRTWRSVPMSAVVRSIEHLKAMKEQLNATEAVVVVFEHGMLPDGLSSPDIHVLSFLQFRKYLRNVASPAAA